MRAVSACFLLAYVCVQAQGLNGQGAGTAMSTFHDDTLHLSYQYPSSYTDASGLVGPAFQASLGGDPAVAKEARCLSLPFSRSQTGTGKIGIVLLVRADAGCLKKSFNAHAVAEMAQGEAQGLAASGAKTSFGQSTSFQLAERPATALEGSFTLPTGQALQAKVVCVLNKPDIVCWQFLASTAAAIGEMSQFPVTFEGSPAAPLTVPTPGGH